MNSKTSLIFQDNGAPYCKNFDDIYFDSKTGCQQSTTVFIEANKIVDRLKNNDSLFTIAETGFGTGLNFLLTLEAYKLANNNAQLENNSQVRTQKVILN